MAGTSWHLWPPGVAPVPSWGPLCHLPGGLSCLLCPFVPPTTPCHTLLSSPARHPQSPQSLCPLLPSSHTLLFPLGPAVPFRHNPCPPPPVPSRLPAPGLSHLAELHGRWGHSGDTLGTLGDTSGHSEGRTGRGDCCGHSRVRRGRQQTGRADVTTPALPPGPWGHLEGPNVALSVPNGTPMSPPYPQQGPSVPPMSCWGDCGDIGDIVVTQNATGTSEWPWCL